MPSFSPVGTHVSVTILCYYVGRGRRDTSWARWDKTDDHIIIKHISAISMDRSTLGCIRYYSRFVLMGICLDQNERAFNNVYYTHNTVYASSRWGEIKYRQFDRHILNHWNVFDRRVINSYNLVFRPVIYAYPRHTADASTCAFRCSKSKKMFTSRTVYKSVTVGASYTFIQTRIDSKTNVRFTKNSWSVFKLSNNNQLFKCFQTKSVTTYWYHTK